MVVSVYIANLAVRGRKSSSTWGGLTRGFSRGRGVIVETVQQQQTEFEQWEHSLSFDFLSIDIREKKFKRKKSNLEEKKIDTKNF